MTQDGRADAGTTKDDRQRQRAARGVRSRAASASADARPSPPRRRRPALAALAVLLIVGGAALAGLLALRLDSREYVLVVRDDIPVGTEITAEQLLRKRVASEDDLLIREADASIVIGTYARTSLRAGQYLDTTMVVTDPPVTGDLVRVGVGLVSTNVPPGLRSGDEVQLIRVGDGTNPPGALATGLVQQIGATGGGDGLGSAPQGQLATLVVPSAAAEAVVDASANGRLGIALISRGATLDDVSLTVLEPTP